MGIHKMKVVTGSEGELYFMELLEKVGVKPDRVMCRLGSIFGTDYNEYILSDGLYKQIQQYLKDNEETQA